MCGSKMTVKISLTQGQTAVVDDEDGDLASLSWFAHKPGRSRTFYAVRNTRIDGRRTTQSLHRVIAARMGVEGDVDHRDRNGLNCIRKNLRDTTASQNGANRGLNKNNASGVKGVSWDSERGKWFAKIRVNGQQLSLGRFEDLHLAEATVKKARENAFGEFACHE